MEPKFQVILVLVVQTLLSAVGAMPILAPTTTLNETDIVETTANSSLEAAAHYFNDTENEKAQPILLCEPDGNGFIYRFPASATCHLPTRDKPFAVVNITTFMPSVEKQEFEGYECYTTMQDVTLEYNFWSSNKLSVGPTKQGPLLTPEECTKMTVNHVAPNGKGMVTSIGSPGFFTAMDEAKPVTPGLFTPLERCVRTNYMFSKIPLSVDDITMKLNTVASVTESCDITKASCPTTRGVIIWKPKDVQHCNFQVSRETSCILTDNQLTCPAYTMALTNITKVELCGATLGFSAQRVLFSLESPKVEFRVHLTLSQTSPTEFVKAKIVPEKKQWKRFKRDVSFYEQTVKQPLNPNPNLKDLGLATHSEMSAMFQFLSNMIEARRVGDVESLQLQICQLAKIVYSSAVNDALTSPSGDVSAFVRTVKSRNNLRARLAGDVIVEEPCQEIRKYVFEWEPSSCFVFPAVRYIYNNQSYRGFLKPGVRQILQNSPTCNPEDRPHVYFDAGEEGVLFINDKRFVELSRLALPTFSEIGAVEYPPTIFGSDATVTLGNVRDEELKNRMLYSQRKQKEMDVAIHKKVSDQPMTKQEEELWKQFSDEVGSSFIRMFLDDTPTSVKVLCAIFALLILVALFGYLKACVPTKAISSAAKKVRNLCCSMCQKASPQPMLQTPTAPPISPTHED